MAKLLLTEQVRADLEEFLKRHRQAELLPTYLYYLERHYGIQPVVFPKEKTIYQSEEALIQKLLAEGKLWRQTQIKIGYEKPSVNEYTKKIYICPFTGKVFGDNTHPNPQDAIYEWVANCPENTERVGGLRAKRFFVSEDADVIRSYVQQAKAPIIKEVYSSAVSGKLFYSKEAVIRDFKENFLKHMTLVEAQNQNRYEIEAGFLAFIREQLAEDKLIAFVEALSEYDVFQSYVSRWIEEGEGEGEEEGSANEASR